MSEPRPRGERLDDLVKWVFAQHRARGGGADGWPTMWEVYDQASKFGLDPRHAGPPHDVDLSNGHCLDVCGACAGGWQWTAPVKGLGVAGER